MSDTLDWRRLYWSASGRGRAVVNGRGIELAAAPMIGGKPVAAMDYAPQVGVCTIRRNVYDAERGMEAWEVADAEAILERAVMPCWGDCA